MVLLVLASAVLLAACGGSDDGGAVGAGDGTSTTGATDHNAADVSFAQGMIPHHQQAIEMADLAAERASSAQVKDLAERIRSAQQPEIDTLAEWLDAWGEKTGSMDGMDDMQGMEGMEGMEGDSGMGMMDDASMQKLEAASGTEFDSMFLTDMIEHHKGAIEMAKTEIQDGAYQPAKDMAQGIVDSQSKEITEMEGLLSSSSK